jgi:hypothetical protein
LWNATTILMGLRYTKDEIGGMIRGVYKMLYGIHGIEESSVYQDIFQKGRIGEAHEFLIFLGSKKFGTPDEATRARIAALADPDQVHELGTRIPNVATWDDLLSSPN